MTTILVTGPIGSGKSSACRYLEAKGWPVYDCDSRCKALYTEVPGLKEKLEAALELPYEEWGRIFDDAQLREKLESMVYPILLEDLRAWKAGLDSSLAFVESAIALDKPAFDDVYDKVLLITAFKSLRLRRNAKARRRDSLQSFDPSKIDYTVRNNGTKEDLYKKIDDYIVTLL